MPGVGASSPACVAQLARRTGFQSPTLDLLPGCVGSLSCVGNSQGRKMAEALAEAVVSAC